MTNRQIFDSLLKRYFQNRCSPEEKKRLAEIIENTDDETISSAIKKQWINYRTPITLSRDEADEILLKIFEKARSEARQTEQPNTKRIRASVWAAASIVLLLCTGILVRYYVKNITASDTGKLVAADAKPGTNGAILILADGSKIVLDSIGNTVKKLPEQNGMKIQLKHKLLVYNAASGNKDTTSIAYNMLITPRGKTFQLTLPDGTNVWLNASSSIHYPVSFDEKARCVTVEGEAYFEVAKQMRKDGKSRVPFILNVHTSQFALPDTRIEVLGTHFNVNAYPEKNAVRTTLLEGSVKIFSTGTGKAAQITPGMAAIVSNGKTIQVEHVNAQDAIDWKNGLFNFNQSRLQNVLMDISRWYNVDIIYEGNIPDRVFWGKMQKSLYLSQVLSVLEKMNVHFRIDRNKLYVMP